MNTLKSAYVANNECSRRVLTILLNPILAYGVQEGEAGAEDRAASCVVCVSAPTRALLLLSHPCLGCVWATQAFASMPTRITCELIYG